MARAGDAPEGQSALHAELRRLDRWNGLVTTPALLLLWAAGLWLAAQRGWFGSLWLHLKLGCVLLLTLIHAFQSLRLKRRLSGRASAPAPAWTVPLAGILVIAIFYLVSAKPD